MSTNEDKSTVHALGSLLGRQASLGADYAAQLKDVTDFLSLATTDEFDSLFFWLEEGVRNNAASTEQTLTLLREVAEVVGYDHEGRYNSTYTVQPTR